MTIVIDASSALRAFLEDEPKDSPGLHDLVGDGLVAPSVFEWEIANALVVSVRRERQVIERALVILSDILTLVDTSWDDEGMAIRAAALAHETGLTAYDASYLALAASVDASLLTDDRRMERAAVAIGIPLVS